MHIKNKLVGITSLIICLLLSNSWAASNLEKDKEKKSSQKSKSAIKAAKKSKNFYQEYIDFYEHIYKTMDENYYQGVSRDVFNEFIKDFDSKIFPQLKEERKSEDYVKWRGADILIKRLKSEEDIFSGFYPPQPAQEYKQTAYAVRIDLGIEGDLTPDGFKVSQVEPRSDAYTQGLRIGNLILKIDGQDLRSLKQEDVNTLLNPVKDSKVAINYLDTTENRERNITVISQEYIKQTVFIHPVPIEGVFCLEIRRFSQKTFEDLIRYMDFIRRDSRMIGLIIDLRGNPGGPPLAAREISSLFLPSGKNLAYFQRKGHRMDILDVPPLPPKYHYDGPMVILVNEGSGSSSELFAGSLQRQGRAILMGTNSAGQVMLKSPFTLDDGSMILLVTARGYYPDGGVFSFSGLIPNKYIKEEEHIDPVSYAAKYLWYINHKKNENVQ